MGAKVSFPSLENLVDRQVANPRNTPSVATASILSDTLSSGGYTEMTNRGPPLQHDYDVQSMVSGLVSRRAGDVLLGMLDTDRSRTRRERTFVGAECAICDEPLEHTLRGERVLKFSCGHVSHEACFYEFIKEFESQYCPTCNAPLGLDASRGGNILDIGKKSDDVLCSYAISLITLSLFRKAK